MDPARRLPPALAERARQFLAGGETAVPARDAATVVLLRDGATGLQVYVLRRHRGMAFAAGMYAFPGGAVDPRDADMSVGWSGPPAAVWGRRLRCSPDAARALVCAAVRETFEESGVLLAGPSPGAVVADTTGAGWERDRAALVDRSLAFADLLRERDLVLRTDLLGAWAHWITPEFEPRRYDTRFFVAALPAGQRTRDVSGEADSVAWVSPAAALAAVDTGAMAMLPPTYVTLRDLTAFGTTAEVLAAAADRPIRTVLPEVEVVDGEVVLMSGDEGGGSG